MAVLDGRLVRLRSLDADDVPALRRMVSTPEVARWWGPVEDAFPLRDEPTATRFAILVDRELAGMIQFSEETEPDYRHASIDLFVDPQHHDEGIGTDAIATLAGHLIESRGHHRITIDPAVANARAVRCYEKAGFRRVGVMRSSWRDPGGVWQDSLLMELVLPPAAGGA